MPECHTSGSTSSQAWLSQCSNHMPQHVSSIKVKISSLNSGTFRALFNSETSILIQKGHPWKSKLRNAWGQEKRVSTLWRCFRYLSTRKQCWDYQQMSDTVMTMLLLCRRSGLLGSCTGDSSVLLAAVPHIAGVHPLPQGTNLQPSAYMCIKDARWPNANATLACHQQSVLSQGHGR